jgi:hypothetical protein
MPPIWAIITRGHTSSARRTVGVIAEFRIDLRWAAPRSATSVHKRMCAASSATRGRLVEQSRCNPIQIERRVEFIFLLTFIVKNLIYESHCDFRDRKI